ncbi:hypothetical protein DIPPA_33247 [Diplonema papillatum]|nr:hypothetical protein DIPPA_33247 [Diplonema papillatum]
MSDNAQTAVEHGQSRSIMEVFEASAAGLWKKFVKWMEAGGLRESAFFLRADEAVMADVLEFVTTVATLDRKAQADCLAAAARTSAAPSPFPAVITSVAKGTLSRSAENIKEVRDACRDCAITAKRGLQEMKDRRFGEAYKAHMELLQSCADALDATKDRREACGRFMTRYQSLETRFRDASASVVHAANQVEAAVAQFHEEQRTLIDRVLPVLEKEVLFFMITLGAEPDLSGKDWSAMQIKATDFSTLGTHQSTTPIGKPKPPVVCKATLPALDLSRAALRGLRFQECDLTRVRLGHDLQGVSFKSCVFSPEQDFADANLTETQFEGCDLSHRSFVAATLAKTSFIFSSLCGIDFTGAALCQVDLRYALLTNARFDDCDLSDCLMHHSDLTTASLANVKGPLSLEDSNLTGAVLDGADLSETAFNMNTCLRGASLRQVVFKEGTDFRHLDLDGVDLTCAQLSKCKFDKLDLSNTEMASVAAAGCSFIGALNARSERFSTAEACVFTDSPHPRLAQKASAAAPYRSRRRLACARNHAAVVQKDGGVLTLGYFPSLMPRAAVVEVACTEASVMTLLEDETVEVWNHRGVLVEGFDDWVAMSTIAGGRAHFAGLHTDGKIVIWRASVSEYPSEPRARLIACGADHCVVLLQSGNVRAWGRNTHGQCTVPDLGPAEVIDVAAGAEHSMAVLADGSVALWGNNDVGQATPVRLFSPAVAGACGVQHTVVLSKDSTLAAWGRNTANQTAVAGIDNVVAVAASGFYTLALLYDGTVVGCGAMDGYSVEQLGLPIFSVGRLP